MVDVVLQGHHLLGRHIVEADGVVADMFRTLGRTNKQILYEKVYTFTIIALLIDINNL